MPRGKLWTTDEDATAVLLYLCDRPVTEIAALLGRTVPAVRHRLAGFHVKRGMTIDEVWDQIEADPEARRVALATVGDEAHDS